jgi:hypothetical protein
VAAREFEPDELGRIVHRRVRQRTMRRMIMPTEADKVIQLSNEPWLTIGAV